MPLFIGLLSLALLFASSGAASAQQMVPPPETPPPRATLAFPVPDAPPSPVKSPESCNQLVLDVIKQMPQGGGYSIKKTALDNLRSSVTAPTTGDSPQLDFIPARAQPSFCSGATYLVFLGVVQELLLQKKLQLSPATINALLIKGQSDGQGIWGRWNANGPGTARLFYELKLGENFESLAQAQPGDFMKIFWNDNIGAKEFGHSVIFLGTHTTPEGVMVRIWSSNFVVGYSEKEVPLVKIKRMLFSRLLNPTALESVSHLPKQDPYLASLLANASTEEEMCTMVGIKKPANTIPDQNIRPPASEPGQKSP